MCKDIVIKDYGENFFYNICFLNITMFLNNINLGLKLILSFITIPFINYPVGIFSTIILSKVWYLNITLFFLNLILIRF